MVAPASWLIVRVLVVALREHREAQVVEVGEVAVALELGVQGRGELEHHAGQLQPGTQLVVGEPSSHEGSILRQHLTLQLCLATLVPDPNEEPPMTPTPAAPPPSRPHPCPRSTSVTAHPPCSTTRCGAVSCAAWAADLPRPTAILIVSAHWESAPVTLSASRSGHVPRLRLRWLRAALLRADLRDPGRLRARAPGRGGDARHRDRSTSTPAAGLDHGAWVPLSIMYPAADIPVLQMSLPTQDPDRLVELGVGYVRCVTRAC